MRRLQAREFLEQVRAIRWGMGNYSKDDEGDILAAYVAQAEYPVAERKAKQVQPAQMAAKLAGLGMDFEIVPPKVSVQE